MTPHLISTAVAVSWITITSAAALSAQNPTSIAPLEAARALALNGNYAAAESVYASVISTPRSDSATLAAAHFGRAFARQRRLVVGDTAGAGSPERAIILDYDRARALDAANLRAPVANNLGMLYGMLGRHEQAIRELRAGQIDAGSYTASIMYTLGREFEALSQPDSAASSYAAALRADSTRVDALRGLLNVTSLSARASTVLAIAKRWSHDTASARSVVLVLSTMMGVPPSPRLGPSNSEAESLLITIVASVPVARIGPHTFDAEVRPRLTSATTAHPGLGGAITAVLSAFRLRNDESKYSDSEEASWWRLNDDRRAAWSSMLRWIGETYHDRKAYSLAASYYEAAVGDFQRNAQARWVDRKALLPLAVIYANDPSADRRRQVDDLDRMARVTARAPNDTAATKELERERLFHLTLASKYSARRQLAPDDSQRVKRQIEQLDSVSQKLNKPNKRVTVPRELLTTLGEVYANSGDTAGVLRVQSTVSSTLTRPNQKATADSINTRISATLAAHAARTREIRRVPPSAATPLKQEGPSPANKAAEKTDPIIPGKDPASSIVRKGARRDAAIEVTGSIDTNLLQASLEMTATADGATVSVQRDGAKFTFSVPGSAQNVQIVIMRSKRPIASKVVDLKFPTNVVVPVP